MTHEREPVPTPVKPGAGFIATGVPTTVVAVMLILASAYAHYAHADGYPSSQLSVPLAWFGWLLLVFGATALGIGVFRLAQHADRAAGYRVAVPWWLADTNADEEA